MKYLHGMVRSIDRVFRLYSIRILMTGVTHFLLKNDPTWRATWQIIPVSIFVEFDSGIVETGYDFECHNETKRTQAEVFRSFSWKRAHLKANSMLQLGDI